MAATESETGDGEAQDGTPPAIPDGPAFPANAVLADPIAQYRVLLEELRQFSPGLIDKPRAVALTKTDLVPAEEALRLAEALRAASGEAVFPISAVTGAGVPALIQHLARHVFARREADRKGASELPESRRGHADASTH